VAEADSPTFSLLNGTNPVTGLATLTEADSLTFSLLNGEAPAVGATVYEVDSPTFSVLNQAPNVAVTARPGRLDSGSVRVSKLAANSSGIRLPLAGKNATRSSTGLAELVPMGREEGQSSKPEQGLIYSDNQSVFDGTFAHLPVFAKVWHRLLHWKSQRKVDAKFKTKAVITHRKDKLHSNSNNRADSALTGGGGVSTSPGQF
jgi:hypothetical protein